MTAYRGECLCGSIAFSLTGALPKLYRCHCSLCRKQSGAEANAAILIRAENFRWLQGESEISCYQRASGFTSHFCRQCGSPVPNPLAILPDYWWVPAGLLPADLPSNIVSHLNTASRAGWDEHLPVDADFPEMPGNIQEFLKLLES